MASELGAPFSLDDVVVPASAYSETIVDPDKVDARTDLYAVGVMLYQMLTGQIPYQSPTAAMRGAEMLLSKPPTPRERNPSVSQSVSDFAMRMFAMTQL